MAIELGRSDVLQLGEGGVVIGGENARHRFIELAARLVDAVGRDAFQRRGGGRGGDLEPAAQRRRARQSKQESATGVRRQRGEEGLEFVEILRAVDRAGLSERAGQGLQEALGIDRGAETRGVLARQTGDAVDVVLIGDQHDLAP